MTAPASSRAHVILARELPPFGKPSSHGLTRIDRGSYVRTDEWEAMFVEGRLRSLVDAVRRRVSPHIGAFSHATALALWGLPVFDTRDDRVEMIVPGRNPRHGAAAVTRHHCPLDDRDVADVGGIRVTSIPRTLFDVSRLSSPAAAIIAFDAALHHVGGDGVSGTCRDDAVEAVRDDVRRRLAAARGARGVRQARFVVDFADGRAASPGESLLRWRVWQSSLGEVVPQYKVSLEGGRHALLDLALPDKRVWFEFDGAVKVRDPVMMAGRTAAGVLADQERRERAIERTTGWRCHRLSWSQVLTLDAFAAFLRSESLSR